MMTFALCLLTLGLAGIAGFTVWAFAYLRNEIAHLDARLRNTNLRLTFCEQDVTDLQDEFADYRDTQINQFIHNSQPAFNVKKKERQ